MTGLEFALRLMSSLQLERTPLSNTLTRRNIGRWRGTSSSVYERTTRLHLSVLLETKRCLLFNRWSNAGLFRGVHKCLCMADDGVSACGRPQLHSDDTWRSLSSSSINGTISGDGFFFSDLMTSKRHRRLYASVSLTSMSVFYARDCQFVLAVFQTSASL